MKYKKELWIMLWLLVIQVFSSKTNKVEKDNIENASSIASELFYWNEKDKAMEKVQEKKMIHDDPKKLTEVQEFYKTIFVRNLRLICKTQVGIITYHIVKYLGTAKRFLETTMKLRAIELSPDNKWLVSSVTCPYYGLALWRVRSGECEWKKQSNTIDEIDTIKLTSDNKYIVTLSRHAGALAILSLTTGEMLHQLTEEDVTDFSLSQDNRFLVSTNTKNLIEMWSVETGERMRVYNKGSGQKFNWPASVYLFDHNRRMVMGGKELVVWDIDTGKYQQATTPSTKRASAIFLRLSDDQHYLLTTGDNYPEDSVVYVWTMSTLTRVRQFNQHETFVTTGCFLSNNTKVASIDYWNSLKIWCIRDGCCLHTFKHQYNHEVPLQHSYCLSSTNIECILVTTIENPVEVHLLAVESGEIVMRYMPPVDTEDFIQELCVSSDGQYLITGTKSGVIYFHVFTENKVN